MRISQDHGHACSGETIGCDVAIFRNSTLTLSVTLFLLREIELHSTVYSHPFSKISPENTGGRVLLLVKLQTDCSEWRLYIKMTPPSSEAAVHSHPFSKISPRKTGGTVLLLVKL